VERLAPLGRREQKTAHRLRERPGEELAQHARVELRTERLVAPDGEQRIDERLAQTVLRSRPIRSGDVIEEVDETANRCGFCGAELVERFVEWRRHGG
jgi:hypothetical protein